RGRGRVARTSAHRDVGLEGSRIRRISRRRPYGGRAYACRHLRASRRVVHTPRVFRLRREKDGRASPGRNDRILLSRYPAVRPFCCADAGHGQTMNDTYPKTIRIGAALAMLVALLAFLVRSADAQAAAVQRLSLG